MEAMHLAGFRVCHASDCSVTLLPVRGQTWQYGTTRFAKTQRSKNSKGADVWCCFGMAKTSRSARPASKAKARIPAKKPRPLNLFRVERSGPTSRHTHTHQHTSAKALNFESRPYPRSPAKSTSTWEVLT